MVFPSKKDIVSFNLSSLRAVTIKLAPILDVSIDIPLPMPEEAPVTNIFLCSRENGLYITSPNYRYNKSGQTILFVLIQPDPKENPTPIVVIQRVKGLDSNSFFRFVTINRGIVAPLVLPNSWILYGHFSGENLFFSQFFTQKFICLMN